MTYVKKMIAGYMSEIFLRLFSWLLFSGLIFSQVSNPDTISVTVYNDNLGVIKESRTVSLKKGFNTIKIGNVAAKIDPTSVRFTFAGNVLEQNYQYDLASFTKTLKRYYNKDVTLIGDKGDVITGTLLSVEDREAVIRVADSGLMLLPYISGYRISVGDLPEGLITTPTLKVDLQADKGGSQNLELAYMTEGLNWHAEYVAVLDTDDKKMDLNAWVSIENNSGISYKNAKLKLVAGEVNQLKDQINVRGGRGGEILYYSDGYLVKPFIDKVFFEYHVYTMQRPSTIANNEIKQISLF